jgi:hypothetical protein
MRDRLAVVTAIRAILRPLVAGCALGGHNRRLLVRAAPDLAGHGASVFLPVHFELSAYEYVVSSERERHWMSFSATAAANVRTWRLRMYVALLLTLSLPIQSNTRPLRMTRSHSGCWTSEVADGNGMSARAREHRPITRGSLGAAGLAEIAIFSN